MVYVYLFPCPLWYWMSPYSCNLFRALHNVREAVPTERVTCGSVAVITRVQHRSLSSIRYRYKSFSPGFIRAHRPERRREGCTPKKESIMTVKQGAPVETCSVRRRSLDVSYRSLRGDGDLPPSSMTFCSSDSRIIVRPPTFVRFRRRCESERGGSTSKCPQDALRLRLSRASFPKAYSSLSETRNVVPILALLGTGSSAARPPRSIQCAPAHAAVFSAHSLKKR